MGTPDGGLTLHDQVEAIGTRDDFVRFVEALRADLLVRGDNWEKATLPDYLAALGRWTADSDGYFRSIGLPVPQQPTWKLFGQILLAAHVYE